MNVGQNVTAEKDEIRRKSIGIALFHFRSKSTWRPVGRNVDQTEIALNARHSTMENAAPVPSTMISRRTNRVNYRRAPTVVSSITY